MVVTLAYVPDVGNDTDWPLRKFYKLLIAKDLKGIFCSLTG
jgi:hypothetical protein